MEPYCSLLYHILDKVVPDINMFGAVMKHEILLKTNPTLVVAEDHGGIQHMSNHLTKELPQPNSITRGHTSSNVFSLRRCSRQPISASCSSRISKQNLERSNIHMCSYDPPHCQPSQHQSNHGASHSRQCISVHK